MPFKLNHGRDDLSLKGHRFDLDDLSTIPVSIQRTWDNSRWTEERKQQEVNALNARYQIVSLCGQCGEPLIREDHLAHLMDHVPSRSRHLVRTLMGLDPAIRKEVLASCAALQEVG